MTDAEGVRVVRKIDNRNSASGPEGFSFRYGEGGPIVTAITGIGEGEEDTGNGGENVGKRRR